MLIVSGCLAGINCNYKGSSKSNKRIIELIKKGKAIPLCPEQLGGLSTPRSGARIKKGDGYSILKGESRLITDDNEDVTEQYIKGAEETLNFAKLLNVSTVILTQKSPSCGSGYTQGGIDSRKMVEGVGVTTALLRKNKIKVISPKDLENDKVWSKILENE